jgi:Type II secretion system (T2SS), protein F
VSGGAVSPALVVLAAALLVWPPRSSIAARRVRSLAATAPARDGEAADGNRRDWLLAGAAGAGAALLLGGVVGLALGGVVTVGGHHLLRRAVTGDPEIELRALQRDLPVACDLLAVCLGAGVPLAGALAAVGASMPSPLGDRLRGVAGLYRLGAEPRRAWADVPAELAPLGRVLVRAGESGSAAVPALRSLAADGRAAARARTDAAVRRAGIWVLAPLGLCFLPAFICLGVVPLILGIAGDVFG